LAAAELAPGCPTTAANPNLAISLANKLDLVEMDHTESREFKNNTMGNPSTAADLCAHGLSLTQRVIDIASLCIAAPFASYQHCPTKTNKQSHLLVLLHWVLVVGKKLA